ncbi:unnamed protein product [Clonostachys rosea f. rosea IK726]|uniref:Uncharacterized protein n=1 Tax=Clonostachys rosea f. rosea IK726 TaxID=1349383 RepID=A0ACA9UEM6_BIOOC|nr:unnamed protein product [Clonostachys rosea f. rosea IK726]
MASPSPADLPAELPDTLLSFTSWNDDKPTTIVLLHGGFTCRLEFALVLPHLSDFHVLLPDLPLHSASRHIQPGTTDKSASCVAQLIRSHAHGGKAHVVGVSMGGYIGQCLALDQPDLVLSLFVTGAAPVVGKRLFMAQWTRVTYYTMKLMLHWLPDWVYRYQNSLGGLSISNELLGRVEVQHHLGAGPRHVPVGLVVHFGSRAAVESTDSVYRGAKGDDVPMIERTARCVEEQAD